MIFPRELKREPGGRDRKTNNSDNVFHFSCILLLLYHFSYYTKKSHYFFSKGYMITLVRVDYISNTKVVYAVPIQGLPKAMVLFC